MPRSTTGSTTRTIDSAGSRLTRPAQIHSIMIKNIFSLVLVTGLLGCDRTDQHSNPLPVDKGLRGFFNVHSLDAKYEMPAGHTAYQVAVLEFEDGKLSRRGASSLGKMDPSGTRTLHVQLLWGDHDGKFKTALVMPGMSGQSESDFWRKLDGGWGSCETKSRQDEHAGFVILGFAQSALDNKGQTNTPTYGEFKAALAEKKYLGALAVRTFKTFEEAKKESK